MAGPADSFALLDRDRIEALLRDATDGSGFAEAVMAEASRERQKRAEEGTRTDYALLRMLISRPRTKADTVASEFYVSDGVMSAAPSDVASDVDAGNSWRAGQGRDAT